VSTPLGIRRARVAQAANDLSGSQPLRRNLLEGVPNLCRIGATACEQPVTGLRVTGNGGEWLIQLVRDAGGHLAHGGET
jgi:hypothetical protein